MILDFKTFELNEKKKKNKYTYGCVMLDLNFPEMKEFHEQIDKDDIFNGEEDSTREYGLEKETHVTILYGLHSDDIDDKEVKEICMSFEYGPLIMHNVSSFENEKFDVLKFDIKGKPLNACNEKLSELPFTTDFPDYHPHVTIAYLKPGQAKKYVKKFKDKEYEVTPRRITYSKPEGKKLHWKIKLEDK